MQPSCGHAAEKRASGCLHVVCICASNAPLFRPSSSVFVLPSLFEVEDHARSSIFAVLKWYTCGCGRLCV